MMDKDVENKMKKNCSVSRCLKALFRVVVIGIFILLGTTACSKEEEPSPVETRTLDENEDEDSGAGIFFDLEDDVLEEESEDVYFNAKEWEAEDAT